VDAVKRLALWLLVAVLSIATLVLYVDNFRTKDCLAGYMVRDAAATKARTDVADEERRAFKGTLLEITSPTSTPQTRSRAIADYIGLLNKDDAVREANPPQPVPTECN
jgi:hypothetical protein